MSIRVGFGPRSSAPLIWIKRTGALRRNISVLMFRGSLAGFVQFGQGAVCRVFVDVAQGGIVKDRVDEEIYAAAEAQAGQSDVNQLAGDLANDMHSQEFAAGSLEDHFDHAFGVGDDLAARMIAVLRLLLLGEHAWHALRGPFGFRRAAIIRQERKPGLVSPTEAWWRSTT